MLNIGKGVKVMNYLVSYDLNTPGKNYSGVYDAIKNASTGTWCKPLESVYIIQSNLTAQEIYNRVNVYLDSSDCILVIEVINRSYWRLTKNVSDYLGKML